MSSQRYCNEKKKAEYLEIPDKSVNDQKHYKTLVLSNGLKALLISDPISISKLSDIDEDDENYGAVALLVDVGSLSDPYKYQGLAHCLECMISMGSKKYPTSYALFEQMKELCGDNDANTEREETVFAFRIPLEHLDDCLDYFTDPFKAPLLLKEELVNSREFYDSELPINLLDEDDEILSQILTSSTNQNCPLNTREKEVFNYDDWHKELVAFHLRHYSANRMYVCIQAALPVNDLEYLVMKHFSNIPSNDLPGNDFSIYDYRQVFMPQFHEEVYFLKPMKPNENICKLELIWILPPPMKNSYKYKPYQFMSYLIGYQGEGSLFYYLKKRLWATDLNAYAASNPICALFKVCIFITDLGFRHLDKILHATFVYIKELRHTANLREIYEELSSIKAANFQFGSEKGDVYDVVKKYVKNLKYYNPKDILSGPVLYYEYDEEQIENTVKYLNEFNFNITITSKENFNEYIKYDKKAKRCGIEYATIKMPKKWQDLWKNCNPIPELYLPKPNRFLSKDFGILQNNTAVMPSSLAPKKILETDICELWFRQDDKFLVPKAYMNFYFMSPLLRQSAKNYVLCTLYVQLIENYLVEQLYLASEAGLNGQLISTDKGIIIMINGYNEKLHLLVELITEAMTCIDNHITADQFEMRVKDLKNKFLTDVIYSSVLADNLISSVVKNIYWSTSEKYKCLTDITMSDILEFARTFTKELYVRSLMQGNLTEDLAQSVLTSVMTKINCRNIKEKKYIEDRTVKLPKGSKYILCKNIKKNIICTVVKHFYQIGIRTIHIDSILQLSMEILEYPFVHTIRENLSYTHYSGISTNYGTIGYYFTVHTEETRFKSWHVEECMTTFHNGILKIVEEMSQEDFEQAKKTCIKSKQVVDNILHDDFHRNWNEVINEEYIFDRRQREIEVLLNLKKQDIIDFWIDHLSCNQRKLSVHDIGNDMLGADRKDSETDEELFQKMDLKFQPREGDVNTIVDINKFKDSLEVYAVTKPLL